MKIEVNKPPIIKGDYCESQIENNGSSAISIDHGGSHSGVFDLTCGSTNDSNSDVVAHLNNNATPTGGKSSLDHVDCLGIRGIQLTQKTGMKFLKERN